VRKWTEKGIPCLVSLILTTPGPPTIPFILKERAYLVAGYSIRPTFTTPQEQRAFLADFMASFTNWFQCSVLKCAGCNKC